jgi:hypothetical protein
MTKSRQVADFGAGGFYAGKNKIINGDFLINQRAFSSSTSGGYKFDRWGSYAADGTVTYSAQTFTLGTAPVAGYEGKNFFRMATTGQTATSAAANISQPIESVRTLAGQTATISFWAKAASGTPKVAVEYQQQFGSGGSPSVSVGTYAGQVTLSTSWARYSLTVAIPSIAGKTLGTSDDGALTPVLWTSAGSDFNARTGSLGIQTATIDFWGVQVEAGSVATPFSTATGTLQGELAACQRYYVRLAPGSSYGIYGAGYARSTTAADFFVTAPVQMRIAPTSVEYSLLTISLYGSGNYAFTSLSILNSGPIGNSIYVSGASGLTQYRPYFLGHNNQTTGYLAFSAEL